MLTIFLLGQGAGGSRGEGFCQIPASTETYDHFLGGMHNHSIQIRKTLNACHFTCNDHVDQ